MDPAAASQPARSLFRVTGRLAALAAALGAGCTFYTGQPQASQPASSAGSGAAAGRSGNNGGTGSVLANGGDAGDAGNAGDAGSRTQPGKWVDATGNLAGRTDSQGVVYVSASPDSKMLIAGVGNDGLYSSTDSGVTWTPLGQTGASDLITNRVTSIVYDPDHPQVFWETGIYVGGGLYHSTDNGKTISELGTGAVRHNDLVSVDFTDPKRRTLLVGGHEQSQVVYLSTDAGETWTQPGAAIPKGTGFSSAPLVLDSQTFLLGVANAILRSADGGASWTTVSKAGGSGPPIQTSDGSIYWLIDGIPAPMPCSGVMRSGDQGLSWTRAVGAGVIYSTMIALPGGGLASETATNLIVSRDQGATWTVVSAALPFQPKGFAYSTTLKAFFIWSDSAGPKIPAYSIARYDWNDETQ
ncbi:MAG: hypothetical protein ABI488_21355 [Polyangiaceae bacterium]